MNNSIPFLGNETYGAMSRNPGKTSFLMRKKTGYLRNLITSRYFGNESRHNMLEVAMGFLNLTAQTRVLKAVHLHAKQRGISLTKNNIEGFRKVDAAPYECLADILRTSFRLAIPAYRAIARELETILSRPVTGKADPVKKRLDELASLFKLDEAALEMLLICHLYRNDRDMDTIVDRASESLRTTSGRLSAAGTPRVASLLSGLPPARINMAFDKNAPLRRMRLMDDDGDVVCEVMNYLQGLGKSALSERYFRKYTGNAVPLSGHVVPDKDLSIIRSLLAMPREQGLNILLYGEPGTGKTEFARSLCQELGITLYELNHMNEDKGSTERDFRFRALMACQHMTDPAKSLILIDEADAMLNTQQVYLSTGGQVSKGMLNSLIDESTARRIWITNHYDAMDDSTRRRFDYSLRFNKMTKVQRLSVWKSAVKKHGLTDLLDDAMAETLSGKYDVAAGGIEVALRNVKPLRPNLVSGKEAVFELIDTLLKAHAKVLEQKDPTKNAEANARNYSIDGLHIRGSLNETMTMLRSFDKYWREMENKKEKVRNMNMLMYGPPGTGKTEFAKYLAREFERPIIVKQASDLLSMWVGGSEKLIRQAFEDAQKEKGILFIDEADGLFASREGASHSWQVTQANELLQNMEKFEGMLICSTNFKKNLDPAAIRRFNLKLEFDYLKPEGCVIFYGRTLADLVSEPLGLADEARLRDLEYVAPGDFKVVYQKYFFMPKETLTHAKLIEALKEEVRNKEGVEMKRMGF